MDGGTNINELPDMILAKIFKELQRKERLKIERVCKKWQHVGNNLSWTNYRKFDNYNYRTWTKPHVLEKVKPFLDRCGRHLRLLTFDSWSPDMILPFIRMASNVQHLKFGDVELNDESLTELAQIAPQLKSLHLRASLRSDKVFLENSFFVTNDISRGLIKCFKVMTCLEYLYISEYSALLDPYPFVQFPPNLKYVSLNHIQNTDQILNWVAKGCTDLKALCVSGVSVTDNGCRAISQMKNLTYLDVPFKNLDHNDVGYIFAALAELRAIKISTAHQTVITAITRYCKKLEHLNLWRNEISPEVHANILRVATLPNFCSLDIWTMNYPKERSMELISQLISNGKLKHINLENSAPIDPEILFELLRRCKSIRTVDLSLRRIEYSDFYAKICQVVDEIDENDRQQREFNGVTHPIVEVKYWEFGEKEELRAQYKWLQLKNHISQQSSDVPEKWQYGWFSAGKPDWV